MNEPVKIYAENNFMADGISLFFLMKAASGESRIGKQIEFVEIADYSNHQEPTLIMRREEAQMLADSLYQCGIRPTEAMGSAGALSAVQEHVKTLKDFSNRLLAIVENKPK